VGFIAPQFTPYRDTVNISMYADVTPKWMIKCMEPHLEAFMSNVPISTFMVRRQ
jgi:hypothetical protein